MPRYSCSRLPGRLLIADHQIFLQHKYQHSFHKRKTLTINSCWFLSDKHVSQGKGAVIP